MLHYQRVERGNVAESNNQLFPLVQWLRKYCPLTISILNLYPYWIWIYINIAYIAYRENPWIVHSTRGAAHVYPQILHWSLNLSTPEIHHLTEHVDSEWQGPSVCFAWILLEEISEKCLCLKFGHPLVIIFPIFPLKNVGNGHAKISSKTLLMTITAMTSGHLYDIRGIPSIGGSLGDTSK